MARATASNCEKFGSQDLPSDRDLSEQCRQGSMSSPAISRSLRHRDHLRADLKLRHSSGESCDTHWPLVTNRPLLPVCVRPPGRPGPAGPSAIALSRDYRAVAPQGRERCNGTLRAPPLTTSRSEIPGRACGRERPRPAPRGYPRSPESPNVMAWGAPCSHHARLCTRYRTGHPLPFLSAPGSLPSWSDAKSRVKA